MKSTKRNTPEKSKPAQTSCKAAGDENATNTINNLKKQPSQRPRIKRPLIAKLPSLKAQLWAYLEKLYTSRWILCLFFAFSRFLRTVRSRRSSKLDTSAIWNRSHGSESQPCLSCNVWSRAFHTRQMSALRHYSYQLWTIKIRTCYEN